MMKILIMGNLDCFYSLSGIFTSKIPDICIHMILNAFTLWSEICKKITRKGNETENSLNKKYKDRKLHSIITSEEGKFWKFISNKKYLNIERINLDKRLLKNFI